MPATVVVNSLTVVHKSSNGTSPAFPDVCKTPSPAGPIPIPYPNIAMSSDTADGASTVKCDGDVDSKVGATQRCTAVVGGQNRAYTLTVTDVADGKVSFSYKPVS